MPLGGAGCPHSAVLTPRSPGSGSSNDRELVDVPVMQPESYHAPRPHLMRGPPRYHRRVTPRSYLPSSKPPRVLVLGIVSRGPSAYALPLAGRTSLAVSRFASAAPCQHARWHAASWRGPPGLRLRARWRRAVPRAQLRATRLMWHAAGLGSPNWPDRRPVVRRRRALHRSPTTGRRRKAVPPPRHPPRRQWFDDSSSSPRRTPASERLARRHPAVGCTGSRAKGA